ncbi:MAG: MinD/ParA family protein [Candidatus Omnitrophica bacterium]|nr:MinD/ParA family protein [Candidatus Omnitrophota bacterium]
MLDQATRLRELASSVSDRNVTTKKIVLEQPPVPRVAAGKIIAITSGKGGVGKTNFVTNVALQLAKFKKKVIIVDLDLGLANVDILLNLTPKYNIEDVIRGRKSVEEVILEGPQGVKLLPGGSGISRLADLDDQERNNFIKGFTTLKETYDYILLDTAAGISKNVIEFVLIADEAIVVTTPEPTAITDAYAAIKIIGKRNKDMDVYVLFNMVQSEHEAQMYFKKINQVIRQFLNMSVTYLGYIIDDQCVKQSIMRRKAFSIAYPFSHATRSVHLAARQVIKHFQAGEQRSPSILDRFRKIFG